MMLGTSRTPASPGGSFTSLRDRLPAPLVYIRRGVHDLLTMVIIRADGSVSLVATAIGRNPSSSCQTAASVGPDHGPRPRVQLPPG